MSYTWTFVNHGARVMFAPGDGVTPTEVGTVANGLVAEALCRALSESDPGGALLRRNGNCRAYRNSGADHPGECWFGDVPPGMLPTPVV